MAVSSSVGRQFTIERLCLLAYQSVGLVSVHQGTADSSWPDLFAYARDALEIIVDGLSNHNVHARARSFHTFSITAADVTAQTYIYAMPNTVLDILEPAAYIPASAADVSRADGEGYIRIITAEEWQRLGSKGSVGTPVMLYPDRTVDPVKAVLWPIPDEAGSVRVMVQRKLADTDDGNATLDLENYWNDYLITALGENLAKANSCPEQQVASLRADAVRKLAYARGTASQRGRSTIALDHPTGWASWRR